jgi:hypothetical protein
MVRLLNYRTSLICRNIAFTSVSPSLPLSFCLKAQAETAWSRLAERAS